MTSPAAGPSSGASSDAVRSRLKAVCVDCAHPHALARWWAPVLGYTLRPYSDSDLEELRAQGLSGPEEDPAVALDPPDGAGPTVWFNQVAEPKTVKDRVHLDVYGDWQDIVARGAILLRPPGEVGGRGLGDPRRPGGPRVLRLPAPLSADCRNVHLARLRRGRGPAAPTGASTGPAERCSFMIVKDVPSDGRIFLHDHDQTPA